MACSRGTIVDTIYCTIVALEQGLDTPRGNTGCKLCTYTCHK